MFHVKHLQVVFGNFIDFSAFLLKSQRFVLYLERIKNSILRQLVRRRKAGASLAKTTAIVNQKGGVGKTTTCVNLTSALKSAGKRVLLCDFDPQANSTSGMGVDKAVSQGIYDVLINSADIRANIAHTRYGDVLPSSKALAGAGIEMIEREGREFLLQKALAPIAGEYDFILIDCPPSLELLTVNALVAADNVLIPMQCEYYALEGITDLLTSIKMCSKRLNRRLGIEGIVLTMYDSRANLTTQVANELRRYLGDKVYETVIPRSVRLSEAPSHGLPGVVYDRINRGSKAYMALAVEFIARSEK